MKRSVQMVAAPTGIQPGAYVGPAYPDGAGAVTPRADISVEKAPGGGWVVTLAWACPSPVDEIRSDTNRFADAAALLVPMLADTPLITMGFQGHPVEGFLWRADWEAPVKIAAEGFGTVARHKVPDGWVAHGAWENGVRTARFEIAAWPALAARQVLGFAIWQGAARQRAGLKSVCPDWIAVET